MTCGRRRLLEVSQGIIILGAAGLIDWRRIVFWVGLERVAIQRRLVTLGRQTVLGRTAVEILLRLLAVIIVIVVIIKFSMFIFSGHFIPR